MNYRILFIVVVAQFFCTSLWFASNGVMSDLLAVFDLSDSMTGSLTSAVQFGFISGTLIFAVLCIADRFSPSKVFFVSAVLGALFNLGLVWGGNSIFTLLLFRFATGFFLAGIYPIGMKIASDHFGKELGKALGFLVGALVLGTALPHLLKDLVKDLSWQYVLVITSLLAMIGGSMMLIFINDGKYRQASQGLDFTAIAKVFKRRPFREASFGYFGHMWELYAFWAFVPILLTFYSNRYEAIEFNVSLYSFTIIGIGAFGCVFSGNLSQKLGVKHVAKIALRLSMICCILLPFVFHYANSWMFILFMHLWGIFVIADSPLFSTLVANEAPSHLKGTALTIVNCIGFAISIISIEGMTFLYPLYPSPFIFISLAIGPILGLYYLKSS